jgi:hypothetical protein
MTSLLIGRCGPKSTPTPILAFAPAAYSDDGARGKQSGGKLEPITKSHARKVRKHAAKTCKRRANCLNPKEIQTWPTKAARKRVLACGSLQII